MLLAPRAILHEFKTYFNTLVLIRMVIHAMAFGAFKFYLIFL